jgi:hypothetical protein
VSRAGVTRAFFGSLTPVFPRPVLFFFVVFFLFLLLRLLLVALLLPLLYLRFAPLRTAFALLLAIRVTF